MMAAHKLAVDAALLSAVIVLFAGIVMCCCLSDSDQALVFGAFYRLVPE